MQGFKAKLNFAIWLRRKAADVDYEKQCIKIKFFD